MSDPTKSWLWGQNTHLTRSVNGLMGDVQEAYDTIEQYEAALTNKNRRIQYLEQQLAQTDDMFTVSKERLRAAKYSIRPLVFAWTIKKYQQICMRVNNGKIVAVSRIAKSFSIDQRREINLEILAEAEWQTMYFTLKHNIADFMMADVMKVKNNYSDSALAQTATGQYPEALTQATVKLQKIEAYNHMFAGKELEPPAGSLKALYLEERVQRWRELGEYETEEATLPMFQVPRLRQWLSQCPLEYYFISKNGGMDHAGQPYTDELISHPLNPVNLKDDGFGLDRGYFL
ncbi:hypothetical protein [Reinekea sp. G2M2-21]|uniref:hypothetical protein n=1 Tax=Reinekea sp. G2M2-21 TaxID=2788942 RepID=UPI0018AB9684|nr:hypothetical protein [Reinekea sp. G2M2-21]